MTAIDEAEKLKLILDKLVVLQEKAEGPIWVAKWASYRAAFQATWRSEEVNALELRLLRYREELDSHILVTMNAKLDKHDARIVEVLAINNQLQSRLGEIEEAAALRHSETVAAILTEHDGNSTTITRRPTADFENQPGFSSSNVSQIQFLYGKEAVKDDGTSHGAQTTGVVQTRRDFSDVSKRILDALHFRTIDERVEVIPDAYSRTFEWIWGDHEGDLGRWSSFSRWLKAGSGCYWIGGKAGSGKSTLMKYIQADPRTQGFLRQWADYNQLLTASFFFWNAGTTLQKSQPGLMRSLLFEILEKRSDMIPVLFPSLYRTLATRYVPTLDISFHELKRALSILLSKAHQETKICLFIDGLDEYEGDHNEVTDLFVSANASDALKFVVSSRPIPACVAAFSGCPSLRLQDLTARDIALYVEGKLSNHGLMRRMEANPSGRGTTAELVGSITSKASGVFLWVMLVVKSLLSGLQNSDTRIDLLQRLDKLPVDLETLYKHMLGSMSLEYQRKASTMIQLVMRSAQIQQEAQMTVLQLSYAEEEMPSQSIKARIEPITEFLETARCESTEGRMRSRCCGLIESQELMRGTGDIELCVGFLHRTVLEFLKEPAVWQGLLNLTRDLPVNLDELLLGSCLDEMKRKPPGGALMRSRAAINLHHAIAYYSALESRSDPPQVAYLDEMYKVMNYYSRLPLSGSSGEDGQDIWALEEAKLDGCYNSDLKSPHPFLLLVAFHGLSRYLMYKIQDPWADQVREKDKSLLLFHLILNFSRFKKYESDGPESRPAKLLRCIKALLDHNLDPNTEVLLAAPWHKIRVSQDTAETFEVQCGPQGEYTPWRYVLSLLLSSLLVNDDKSDMLAYLLNCCELLESTIRAGGDLQLQITNNRSKKQSARSVIHDFLIALAYAPSGRTMATRILSSLNDCSAQGYSKYGRQTKAEGVDALRVPEKKLSRFFTKLKI
jgi:hypothetical protein